MGHRKSDNASGNYGFLANNRGTGDNYKFGDVYLYGPYNPANEGYDNSFYKISKNDRYKYIIDESEKPQDLTELIDKRYLENRLEKEWKHLEKHCPANGKEYLEGFNNLNVDGNTMPYTETAVILNVYDGRVEKLNKSDHSWFRMYLNLLIAMLTL
jgi:hypothetical protein